MGPTLSQTTHFRRLYKLKEFADSTFEFDENGGKFSKTIESTVRNEKLLFTSIFSLFHSVFERLLLQAHKNKGLFVKWLAYSSSFIILIKTSPNY